MGSYGLAVELVVAELTMPLSYHSSDSSQSSVAETGVEASDWLANAKVGVPVAPFVECLLVALTALSELVQWEADADLDPCGVIVVVSAADGPEVNSAWEAVPWAAGIVGAAVKDFPTRVGVDP